MYTFTDDNVDVNGRYPSHVKVLTSWVYFWEEYFQFQHSALPHQIWVATQGYKLALNGVVSWTDSSLLGIVLHWTVILSAPGRRLSPPSLTRSRGLPVIHGGP